MLAIDPECLPELVTQGVLDQLQADWLARALASKESVDLPTTISQRLHLFLASPEEMYQA